MKRFLCVGMMVGVTALAGAADFSRTGSDSITMRGPVVEGDVDQLRQLATPGTTVLRINSDGGDPQAAMRLGRYLRQQQWSLAIDTVCAGSCALYVFPAAHHKRIPDTAVLALQESASLRAQEGPQHMRRSLIEVGVPADELERATAALAVQLAQVAAQADGVRQRFPDQEAAVYWWPAAARLQRCYGIAGVDEGPRAARLAPDGYLYVPALSALVMGDQALQACP